MKRCVGFLIVFLALSTSPGWAQRQTVRSPEVAPDRMVTFRLLAPKATEVTLTGEFMKGSKNLQKDEGGLWTVTLGPIGRSAEFLRRPAGSAR